MHIFMNIFGNRSIISCQDRRRCQCGGELVLLLSSVETHFLKALLGALIVTSAA